MQKYDCMPIQLSGFFFILCWRHWRFITPNYATEIWPSFIRSMIFNSVAVGGFRGGPPAVYLACLQASMKDFLAPCYTFPHLNLTCTTDLRWTPSAFTNSVTSAHFAFFWLFYIKLLCFALSISSFFSTKSVNILISA